MPTETFAVEDAAGAAHSKFRVTKLGYMMDQVKDHLVAAGWGLDEDDQPQGLWQINFPYSAPTTWVPDPLPTKVDIYDRDAMLTYQGYDEQGNLETTVRFLMYDPYRENPIADDEIVWVARALTAADTIDNLAGAIVGNTPFSLEGSGVYMKPPSFPGETYYVIPLEADEGGTTGGPFSSGGGTTFSGSGSGYWNDVNYNGGAGWKLTESYSGTALTFTMLIRTAYPGALFRLQEGSSFVTEVGLWHDTTGAELEWDIVCSRYQFFLWTDDDQRDTYFAAIPWRWAGKGIAKAAVMSFGLGWRESFVWASGWSRLAINSGFVELLTPADPFRLAGVCCSWNEGPFLYGLGDDLIENPFIMAPRADLSVSEGSRIVGKFWNAFVMRRDATLGERILFENELYYCVSRNVGTSKPAASLWIRIG